MGIVALVILSVSLGWAAFTGGYDTFKGVVSGPRQYNWFEGGRALKRFYEYQPPERKSVIVDISGMSYRTADGTQPTKRDRSKPYPRFDSRVTTDSQQFSYDAAPHAIPQASFETPGIVQASTPLYRGQVEEAPMLVPPVPPRALVSTGRLSIGRQVQTALLADNSLSRSAQLTLNVLSTRNKVTLRGIVIDQDEKDYIGAHAERIAGTGNVDNRLTVL